MNCIPSGLVSYEVISRYISEGKIINYSKASDNTLLTFTDNNGLIYQSVVQLDKEKGQILPPQNLLSYKDTMDMFSTGQISSIIENIPVKQWISKGNDLFVFVDKERKIHQSIAKYNNMQELIPPDEPMLKSSCQDRTSNSDPNVLNSSVSNSNLSKSITDYIQLIDSIDWTQRGLIDDNKLDTTSLDRLLILFAGPISWSP